MSGYGLPGEAATLFMNRLGMVSGLRLSHFIKQILPRIDNKWHRFSRAVVVARPFKHR